jgi:hypothetical protein
LDDYLEEWPRSIYFPETAVRLQQAGLTPLGIGIDVAAAYQPVFQEVKGVRLALAGVEL